MLFHMDRCSTFETPIEHAEPMRLLFLCFSNGGGVPEVEATRVEAPCQYHLDGSWYQHHLFCPQQAIIVCVVLTDP